MRCRGFSLIECLIALALMAVVVQLSVYGYGYLHAKQAVRHDIEIIETHLLAARQQALLQQREQKVSFDDLPLSGSTSLKLSFFPKNKDSAVVFNVAGHTHFQNGSIWVCHKKFNTPAQRIVINQGGRVYVTQAGESKC